MEEWSEWECGDDGVARRHRKVATLPFYGGKACDPGTSEATYDEDDPEEPKYVEARAGCQRCELGDWGSWGACEDGRQRRTKIVRQEPHLAAACDNPVEERDCVRDCEMSEWSDYGACEVGGTAIRTRSIKAVPANGGEACGETKESMACVEHSAVENRSCQHPARTIPLKDLIVEDEGPQLFLASSECGKDTTRLVARETSTASGRSLRASRTLRRPPASARGPLPSTCSKARASPAYGEWQFSRLSLSEHLSALADGP